MFSFWSLKIWLVVQSVLKDGCTFKTSYRNLSLKIICILSIVCIQSLYSAVSAEMVDTGSTLICACIALSVPFYHSAFLFSSSLVLQGCLIRWLNLLQYLQPIVKPHWYTIFVFHHPLFLYSWKGPGKAAHFHFKPFAGCSDANVLLRTLCSNLHKKNNSLNFCRLITGETITFEGDGTLSAIQCKVQLGLGLNTQITNSLWCWIILYAAG